MKNLSPSDYAEFYSGYISLVPEVHCVNALKNSMNDFVNFMEMVPFEKYNYKYQVNKWTMKDVVRHIVDAERIFAYRALRIARFDKTPMSGFEENDYAANVDTTLVDINNLIEEFILVRKSTIKLFESFSEKMLSSKGMASGKEITVLALGFIISGHVIHHQNVLQERYL
ncbi:DinB family protein [Flavobacterium sp.]|uniref:DinB family protein n=1 Tax=Flavobacterium sp. TaxID=239 RepID=UPI00286E160F|nr:DinB family protein [Flavobacterium sp.]